MDEIKLKILEDKLDQKEIEINDLKTNLMAKYEEDVEKKRKELVLKLEKLKKEIELLEKDQHYKFEQLCKTYGHYYISDGTTITCMCCKKENIYGNFYKYPTADSYMHHYPKEKTDALKNIMDDVKQKRSPLDKEKEEILNNLNNLLEEYINKKFVPYDKNKNGNTIYKNGSAEDVEKVKKDWYIL